MKKLTLTMVAALVLALLTLTAQAEALRWICPAGALRIWRN